MDWGALAGAGLICAIAWVGAAWTALGAARYAYRDLADTIEDERVATAALRDEALELLDRARSMRRASGPAAANKKRAAGGLNLEALAEKGDLEGLIQLAEAQARES